MEKLLKKNWPPKSLCCNLEIVTDEIDGKICSFCDRVVCQHCGDSNQIIVGELDAIDIVPCPFCKIEGEE